MAGIEKTGMFIDNPETFVDTVLYRGGELGNVYNQPRSNNMYQLVKLVSTSDAALVAKDVCYWSDPATYLITRELDESHSTSEHSFAGVVTIAVPVSSYAFVKVRGSQSTKAASGTKGVATVPNSGANNDVIDNTELLFKNIIGYCHTAVGGGFAGIMLQWQPV